MAKTASIELATAYVSIVPYLEGFTKTVQKELSGIDGTSAGRKTGTQFSNAFNKSIDTKPAKTLGKAVETAMGEAERATKEADRAQAEYNRTVKEYGADSAQAQQAEKALTDAKQRGETASKALKTAQESLAKAQRDAAQAARDNGFDQLSDDLKNVRQDAVQAYGSLTDIATGIGLAAGVGKAIQSGLDQINIGGTLRAKLGDTQAAKDAAAVAGQVYAEGWGESLEQVGDVAATVSSMVGDVGQDELGKITRASIVLSDTMGSDLGETIRAVDNLMDNFGITSDEAMDLLTAGIQRGLNRSDELADNITEYSGRWADAGMSASQYFSLLQAGMDNGAYSLDKVGDFLNEFLTSLNDGRMEEGLGNFSQGTQEVFNQYKRGEKTAKDVLDAVIGELNTVTDETKRASIASELWSSLGEDNAWSMIGALANVSDSYADVSGAADEAVKNAAGVEQEWTQFVRTVEKEVGQALMPVIEEATGFIEEHGDQIGDLIGDVADTVGTLAEAFLDLPEPVQLGIGSIVLFGGKITSAAKGVSGFIKITKDAGGKIADLFTNGFGKTKPVETATKAIDAAGVSMDGTAAKTGKASKAFGGFSGAQVGFGVAAAGIAAAAWAIGDQMEKDAALSEEFQQAMLEGADAAQGFWNSLERGDTGELGFFDKFSSGAKNVRELVSQAGTDFDTFERSVMGSGHAMSQALNDATADTGGLTNSIQDLVNTSKIPLFGNIINLAKHGDLMTLSSQIVKLGEEYKSTVQQMVEVSQTQDGINVGYSRASSIIGELTTTLKANGDALADNGQLSQETTDYINGGVNALWDAVAAQMAYGEQTGDTGEALQQAKNQIQLFRDQLIDSLVANGMASDAAAAYADSLGLIPSNITTSTTFYATTDSVDAYLNRLGLLPEQKTTVMDALTAMANGNIDSLKLNMDSLPDVVQSILTADNTDALTKTGNAKLVLDEYGNLKEIAIADVNDSPAQNNVGRATTSVRNFGGQHATATVDVKDNASGTLQNILGRLIQIAGNWIANVFTSDSTGGPAGHARGGYVGLAVGGEPPSGLVKGPGSHKADRVLTALSPDEYVIKAESAQRIGTPALSYMNRHGALPPGLDYETRTITRMSDKTDTLPTVTPDALEQAVYRALLRVGPMGIRLDSGVMAGELAPALDRELGRRQVRGL